MRFLPLILSAILVTGLMLPQGQWPAQEDEVGFHRAAILWANEGPQWDGLWHTPAYLETLSVWQNVFGMSTPGEPWVVRSLGLFTALLTLGILFWVLRERRNGWAWLALVATSPYFIQYSLLLDIDNTLLTPAMLLWVIFFERWQGSWRGALGLGVGLALMMMIKEVTPLILFAMAPAWVLWRNPKRLPQALTMVAVGAAGFVLLLHAWGAWRGFGWLDPLHLTREKLLTGQGGSGTPWDKWGWARFGFLSYLPLLWLGIPLLSVLFTRVIKARFMELPFSFWFCAAGVGAYLWLVQTSFYFPKYTSFVLPMGVYAFSQFVTLKLEQPGRFVAGALLILGVTGVLLDPLEIVDLRRDWEAVTLVKHAVAVGFPTLVLLALPQSWWVVGLMALQFGSQVRHVQADHNRGYLYGERGFREAVQTLREMGPSVTPHLDLQWQLGDQTQYYTHQPKEPFEAAVSRTYGYDSIRRNPEVRKRVEALGCHKVGAYGRFEWWWRCSINQTR